MNDDFTKRWKNIVSQMYEFLADAEYGDAPVLTDREKELVYMYKGLSRTDQQIIYGIVNSFYDKTKQSSPDGIFNEHLKNANIKCDFSSFNTTAKSDTETHVMGWV